MASVPRRIVDGRFYHVYNRGNHREPIFHAPRDYERFLWILTDAAAEYGMEVAAYCLMPNHYHVLVRQREGGDLVRMMRSFGVSYVKYYNWNYGQVGHLFQGKYGLRAIESDADLLNISRYIHRNPAGFAKVAAYEWSSYGAYVGGVNRFCDPGPVLQVYREYFGYNYAIFCEPVENSEAQGSSYCVTK